MAFLGMRKWPTPILKPMWPFIAASGVTFYLVSKMQAMGIRSPEYANSPKNPYANEIARENAHH
ncbi:hypothetical protein OE88DRAFT_1687439 [Heliocybe sulcata]|uniref:ATPase, F0 complex, subunit J n=1 Tax=Heliocybe sulcata TaxID=5364 RepID=A0A5C3MPI6_9AGAM|nr:hypothetical protein OE88DRAFT_1687439 [Heliocybe sulcata]